MNNKLNSISLLQKQTASRNTSNVKNYVVNLLQNSEIEFNRCSNHNNLNNFNTGFGGNNDLHYETKCREHNTKTPLYQENYFSEFKTEEERQAARHALGLYNNTDVVLMSLLTTEDTIPSQEKWEKATIKQMQNGYEFFLPLTSFNAVYDSSGATLNSRMRELQELISDTKKDLDKLTQVSSETNISSLGDVRLFLEGFNNTETLRDTIDNIDRQMVRFEKTGEI